MTILKNLRIASKLALAFCLIVSVVVVFSATVYSSMNTVRAANLADRQTDATIANVDKLLSTLVEEQNAMRGYAASLNIEFVTRIKSYSEAVAPVLSTLTGTMDAASGEALRGAVQAFEQQVSETVDALADQARLAQTRNDIAKVARLTKVREVLSSFEAGERKLQEEREVQQTAAFGIADRTLLIGGVLTAVLSAAMGMLLYRGVAEPIVSMTEAMRRLATGDKAIAVPGLGRKDEIGAMAGAVGVFRDAAVEKERLEGEAEASRVAQAASRDRQTAIDNAKAEDLRHFVHIVEAGFERLAAGDLTVRMGADVAAEFEPIRARFDASVASLEQTIGSVVVATGAMRMGLGEISSASSDLAHRTEQQAASLEETVAALATVMRGVDETAGAATEAQTSAATAQKNAEKGSSIVARAVNAMGAIEASSEKIGRIIGVIDEIAFQTNLLALNAGVEAARAGEAGRGFAVVAQEVRGLAQRSAEAAKEIKDLIHTSTAQVGEGVGLVSASGDALQEIVGDVANMANIVGSISRSAREQATSLREVSTAADQMDKVTQQNAAMVEETTAAAQTLMNETDQLAELVEGFKATAIGDATATVRRAPRAVAGPTRGIVQMRTIGSGGATPRQVSEEWTEF